MAKRFSPDHPLRLMEFRTRACGGSWESDQCVAALEGVFDALDDFAQQEIRYYHGRRRRARALSMVTRIGAWATGSVGLVLPLLVAVGIDLNKQGIPSFDNILESGYVLLAIGAGFLAADSFFGGSAAHVRNVSVQLELERLLIEFRLDWLRLRSQIPSTGPSEQQTDAAFNLFHAFSKDLFGAVLRETRVWGRTLTQALDGYRHRMALHRPEAAE